MNEIPRGWRVLTIMAYMGEALSLKGVPFFKLQVYERIQGESVIFAKVQKG